jgi:hypothetical protein
MPTSTSLTPMDHLASSAKAQWEDPIITLERSLHLQAQGGPPTGGPSESGPNYGFVGPLSGSPPQGGCL